MKLSEVIEIKLGMNLSRHKEKAELKIYSNDDLLADLNGLSHSSVYSRHPVIMDKQMTHCVDKGDIVYSFINSIAGLVSSHNSGKIINQNFARIVVDSEKLDSSYLCYLLNDNVEIEKQKALLMQGSTLRKLSPASIRNFDVALPDLDKQRVIGILYLDWLKRQALAKKQLELEESIFMNFLDKMNTTTIEK